MSDHLSLGQSLDGAPSDRRKVIDNARGKERELPSRARYSFFFSMVYVDEPIMLYIFFFDDGVGFLLFSSFFFLPRGTAQLFRCDDITYDANLGNDTLGKKQCQG